MSTTDADRYRNAPAPTRASNALYIPASALKPNEKRYPLHEAETVEKSNQIKALIREQQEAVALAGDDKDRLCRHKLAINELRARLAEVDALLGKQERGVA